MTSSKELKKVQKMIKEIYSTKYENILYDEKYDIYSCYNNSPFKKYIIEQSDFLAEKLLYYAKRNMENFEELTPNFNTNNVIQNYINNMFFNALYSNDITNLFRTNVFHFNKEKNKIILITSNEIIDILYDSFDEVSSTDEEVILKYKI